MSRTRKSPQPWGQRLRLLVPLLLTASAWGSWASAQTPLPPGPAKPGGAAPPPAATPGEQAVPLFTASDIFPPGTEVLSIDLPTALRVAVGANPTVLLAQQRVQEAYAHLTQVQVAWLPNLQIGTSYLRHDGEIQNATGLVFGTNKSALFAYGGAVADVRTSDALFLPIIARRLARAEAANSVAVSHDIQLDVAVAYFDLLQAYAQLGVNADLLARDRRVLALTEAADKAQLAETGADINRARTELQLRLQERLGFLGQVRVTASRLARLLLLKPTVGLLPLDPTVVPLTLIPDDACLDDLVAVALADRPELAQGRELIAASEVRLRQAHFEPLMPHLQVSYLAGGFGGGINDNISNFNGRGDGAATAYWELRNLGLGNIAENRTRQIQVREASTHLVEAQALVSDQVVQASAVALARREALAPAQEAVRQAVEMFRKLDVIAFGMNGPNRQLQSLQPLIAIQQLAQARYAYLGAVMDYNRAQFRLYTAIGQPALESVGKIQPKPVSVPVVPQPFTLPPKP